MTVIYSPVPEVRQSTVILFFIWLNPRAGKMKRILRSDWLPEQAKWTHFARSGFPALVTSEKVLFLAM